MRQLIQFATIAALAVTNPAYAATKAKPVAWVPVKEVHDGDTVALDAEWAVIDHRGKVLFRVPGKVLVRLLCREVGGKTCGINTPEIGGKAKCSAENDAAVRARDNLKALVADSGGKIGPIAPTMDKFGGRLLADIEGRDGQSIGSQQISAGVADLYDGGARDPMSWCDRLSPRDPIDLLEQVKGSGK